MPLSLSHLAEDLLAEMINRVREPFLALAGLHQEADSVFIHSLPKLATCEARLEPIAGRTFDGACRVDVIVRLRPGLAAAFELKLGTTRLTKNRVDEEWLRPCTPSHGGRRWRGNVMAVLDRRFEGTTVDVLRVQAADGQFTLIRPWYVIARRQILHTWASAPPAFSSHVRKIAFEDVVATFGDGVDFNNLVRQMLDVDFYNEWVVRDPDVDAETL